MSAYARCHEGNHPRLLWIALLVLSLWVSWPLASGFLSSCSGRDGWDAWRRAGMSMWQDGFGPMRPPGTWWPPRSSGNHAFDDYRSDTLRRLEEEEKEVPRIPQSFAGPPRTRPNSINSWQTVAIRREVHHPRRKAETRCARLDLRSRIYPASAPPWMARAQVNLSSVARGRK